MAVRFAAGPRFVVARDHKYGRRTRIGRIIGNKPKCKHIHLIQLDWKRMAPKLKNRLLDLHRIGVPKPSGKHSRPFYTWRLRLARELDDLDCDECAKDWDQVAGKFRKVELNVECECVKMPVWGENMQHDHLERPVVELKLHMCDLCREKEGLVVWERYLGPGDPPGQVGDGEKVYQNGGQERMNLNWRTLREMTRVLALNT